MTYERLARNGFDGASYQGLVKIKYPELCAIFGQPDEGSGDNKVQASWKIKIAGGVFATIYDYKEDQPARDVMAWHVGGFNKDVVQLVDIIIKEYRKAYK